MNPFSLLTRGESVKGLKNRSGTYKMLGRNPLPNFSFPKHAATGATRTAPAAPQAVAQPEAPSKPAPVQATPAEPIASPKPVAAAKTTAPVVPATPTAAPGKPFIPEKTSKLRMASRLWKVPASWFANCLPKRKAVSAAQGKTVQTFLALEKVTVIRNDLNCDDLEVVVGQDAEKKTAKPGPEQKFGPENSTANP